MVSFTFQESRMRFFTSLASATATVVFISVSAFAQEYVTIDMEIDIDKPAAEVWQKVGDYCGISEWLGLDCEITRAMAVWVLFDRCWAGAFGNHGGADRAFLCHTQPAVEGEFTICTTALWKPPC